MKKLLFKLRMLYLRYNAGYPKRLTEKQVVRVGKKLWGNFCEVNQIENTMESLWKFQDYALSLSFGMQYALQIFLEEHLKEVESHFPEHDSATENRIHQAYKEKIYAYRHAIF